MPTPTVSRSLSLTDSVTLTDRVVRFGRLLRGAGLKLGPGHVIRGLEALSVVDITRRDEFYGSLHSTWVHRVEDRELFAEAFRLFWRDPDRPVNRVLEELLAASRLTQTRTPAHTRRRVWGALERERDRGRERSLPPDGETVRLSSSALEVLRTKDFEQMTAPELAEAERIIARMRFGVRDLTTRRWKATHTRGPVDMRRTMRAAMREGRDHIPLHWRKRRQRPPGLVVLCDISGSMAGYTRMLLRFLHALTNDRDRVHTFLFGTRLSNITRALRHRDPDVAFFELGHRVRDWEGGTRIGACLAEFNRDWSRRVLTQGAWVLLITDGLDRDDSYDLGDEVARIQRSSGRLVWLNPLLRFTEFRPEARGVRSMLPHVDEFRPVHDLASLEALATALR
jgi:uncharacterized protein